MNMAHLRPCDQSLFDVPIFQEPRHLKPSPCCTWIELGRVATEAVYKTRGVVPSKFMCFHDPDANGR